MYIKSKYVMLMIRCFIIYVNDIYLKMPYIAVIE